MNKQEIPQTEIPMTTAELLGPEQTNKQDANKPKTQEQIKQLLAEEEASLSGGYDGETFESLKLETGKVTKFSVDFTLLPFPKWEDRVKNVTKCIIPVVHKGERKNLWLNVKNPLYGDIIRQGKEGRTEFLVSTTGTQDNTRYTLVEED